MGRNCCRVWLKACAPWPTNGACGSGPKGKPNLVVEGDAVKVRRIAQNLLLNALKYTKTGGVTVRWGNTDSPDHWQFAIVDTGSGIKLPEDNLSPHASAGEGIGLLIVKELCNLLDGQITIVSAPTTGTNFQITLPRHYPVVIGSQGRKQQYVQWLPEGRVVTLTVFGKRNIIPPVLPKGRNAIEPFFVAGGFHNVGITTEGVGLTNVVDIVGLTQHHYGDFAKEVVPLYDFQQTPALMTMGQIQIQQNQSG